MSKVPARVREQVRRRAGQRCEYCRKPEIVAAYPHHVDHILSQKHGGSSETDNLAWACFQCNLNKGSDIAAYDTETSALTAFFNPRTQGWSDHFQLSDGLILGLTPVGRITVRIFQLNHPEQIETRRRLILAGKW